MATITKFQIVIYKEGEKSEWKHGIAALNVGFGHHDVEYIIEPNTGRKLPTIWNYQLIGGPLCYIDLAYER